MHLVVVTHNVRSIHNVGSIFRTADAVGAEKIYLCGITPAPIDRFKKVRADFAKVALGAEKSVVWESATSAPILARRLKKEGYKIYAVEQSKRSIPYYRARVRDDARVALIVGNEVDGLPPSVLNQADQILEIPMQGMKESLNVAIAFGIVAFSLRFGGATI